MSDEEPQPRLQEGWELNVATALTEQIFTIILNKTFLFQPVNPQEYCYHLLSAWDGESV